MCIRDRIRGRHTELVSVYVPARFNINKVAEQIRQEQSTAQNIKSKTVRKNVLGALERILQHLKLYKETPKNGLVIFSGNVSEKEGVADIELWAFEPPEPLNQRLYWCDQKFVLDPLKDMVREREVYGIIVIDKSDADIGVVIGKRIEHLKHLDSIVPGKTTKGGWSQARYQRIREGLLRDFMKTVGEIASKEFKKYPELKGVVIAGPGPIKEEFYEGDFLDYEIKKSVLGVVSTSYTGRYGIEEAIDRAKDLLAEASIMKEKALLDRFFEELGKGSGIAIYGLKEVVNALQTGSVEVLLISEGFDWVKAKLKCGECGEEYEKIVEKRYIEREKCSKCGKHVEVIEEEGIIDRLIKLAEDTNTQVEFISTETKEGLQLAEMGGIAALLRYASS